MKRGLMTLLGGLLAACGQRQPAEQPAEPTPTPPPAVVKEPPPTAVPATAAPPTPTPTRAAPTPTQPVSTPTPPAGERATTTERRLPEDRAAQVRYVALGDSTVAGVGASRPAYNYVSRLHARLREVYPQAQMSNLGVSGATSADVVRGQLRRAVELKPQLITLSIGPNDITQGRDAAQYERNIETIFRTFQQQTAAVIVVNLLPDMALAPIFDEQVKAYVGQQARLFNDALRRLAGRFGVELVDLYTRSQDEVPDHDELLYYHPSDAGYARWAEIMWQGVARRLA